MTMFSVFFPVILFNCLDLELYYRLYSRSKRHLIILNMLLQASSMSDVDMADDPFKASNRAFKSALNDLCLTSKKMSILFVK